MSGFVSLCDGLDILPGWVCACGKNVCVGLWVCICDLKGGYFVFVDDMFDTVLLAVLNRFGHFDLYLGGVYCCAFV